MSRLSWTVISVSGAFTRHLHHNQWGPTQVTDEEIKLLEDSPSIHPQSQTLPPPFSREELTTILNQHKRNRSPGLDDVRNDIILLLDDVGEVVLLDLMNESLSSKRSQNRGKKPL